jgi:hypothetical protein
MLPLVVRLLPIGQDGSISGLVYQDQNENGRYDNGELLMGGDSLLEDVTAVTVTAGQVVSSVHLRALIPNGLISGYLWNDYCLTGENGQPMVGNCVRDDNGFYHADGMIQPTESYIAGVAISLRPDSCTSNSGSMIEVVTDSDGRYAFANLSPGVYCVSMNAASLRNAPLLLPGDWTFPARGVWYHQITLAPGEHLPTVNSGWDYELR